MVAILNASTKKENEMNKVTMYRGIDKRDGADTMFAVRGKEVVKSFYCGNDDKWNTPEGFGRFEDWGVSVFSIDSEIHDHVTGMKVIWES